MNGKIWWISLKIIQKPCLMQFRHLEMMKINFKTLSLDWLLKMEWNFLLMNQWNYLSYLQPLFMVEIWTLRGRDFIHLRLMEVEFLQRGDYRILNPRKLMVCNKVQVDKVWRVPQWKIMHLSLKFQVIARHMDKQHTIIGITQARIVIIALQRKILE